MYTPYARLLQDSLVGWTAYTCFAVVLVVAVTVAIREHRERRRLERALAAARQVPPFRTQPAASPWTEPATGATRHRAGLLRFWLLPLAAILLGLIVTAWSAWNTFAR